MPPNPSHGGHRLGVGVQVWVQQNPDRADWWQDEPTGVIISSGTARPDGAPIAGPGGAFWVVAFDEPQYRADGRGPYTRADIREHFLVAAEPMYFEADHRDADRPDTDRRGADGRAQGDPHRGDRSQGDPHRGEGDQA